MAMVIAHLPALTLIPAVNHDEAAINAAARSWVHSGKISLTLLANVAGTYRDAYYWHPPGHMIVMATAYKLFGYSIFVTRFESLFFGALAASLLFLVVRKVTDSAVAGVIGAILLAAHPSWWWLCRSGRMDTTAIALGLGAILVWQYRASEDISLGRAALVGLLMGIGSLFYPLILSWIPSFLIAEVAARRRWLWKQGVVCAVAGAAPFILWVAAAFAIGDGHAWIEQFWKYQVLQRQALIPFLDRPWGEFHRFVSEMKPDPLFAAAVLAGVGLAWRRIRPDIWRWCAGGLTVSLLLVTFKMGKETGAYPMYWFVWLAILSAAGWASTLVAPARGRRVWRWLLMAGLGNALALHVFFAAVGLYQEQGRDPRRVDAFFAAHLPVGATVIGPEDIWYSVEKAGASLRIWVAPDPARHDFYVTYAGLLHEPPTGFHRVATLKDVMPLVFGKYVSSTSYAYDLWAASPKR